MPNWAFGKVEVTGTRKGVKSFIERFITNDDPWSVAYLIQKCLLKNIK